MKAIAMNNDQQPLSDVDYDAIEEAVLETERGRWFLAQFAKRNRNSDTTVLLDAIKKLENAVGPVAAAPSGGTTPDNIRTDLVDMASAIAQTKREIAALKPAAESGQGINAATEELDAIVTSTETATQDILEAAEKIQEISWTMRELGVEEAYCETIDQLVTGIYTACSFQDITGQRTSKVVNVLRYLEDRLEAMRHIWGDDGVTPPQSPSISDERPDAHLLNGPQHSGSGHDQEDIDLLLGSEEDLLEAVVTPAQEMTQLQPDDMTGDTIELDFDEELAEEAAATAPDVDDEIVIEEEDFVEEQALIEQEPVIDETAVQDPALLVEEAASPEPEQQPAPKGRIIMVRKPRAGETATDSQPDVVQTVAAPMPPPGQGGTALLNQLSADDRVALYS